MHIELAKLGVELRVFPPQCVWRSEEAFAHDREEFTNIGGCVGVYPDLLVSLQAFAKVPIGMANDLSPSAASPP